jgi:DNA helicase IV
VEGHPELEAEQAHVDRAYERLDELRARTQEHLASVLGESRGGTPQFREERDVIVRTSLARLDQLDVGDQALCFGRIDRLAQGADGGGRSSQRAVESFHIGRLGVSSEDLEPLVVDWRAPVAEPFYRATGIDPMGLVLRRHLAASGRRLTGIEDEHFARDASATRPASPTSAQGAVAVPEEGPGSPGGAEGGLEGDLARSIGGPGALLAAISTARSGHMRDIVSTIQREQDETIRAALPGVLVVQGGPGTGKTAVALHRAAYLLYTHRFPLERQGVLVIGPNPLFLRYIEHVLPSLGESGVTLSTVGGLVHGVVARATEPPDVARLKGDARMSQLLARAVRGRQRPLRVTARVPFGSTRLNVSRDESARIVSAARRRPGTHNSRRRFVEQMVIRHLAEQYSRTLGYTGGDGASPNGHFSGAQTGADPQSFDLADFARRIRRAPELVEALDRMWPRLSAEELIHDLFGSRPLVALAAKGILDKEERASLYRPRSSSLEEIPWTPADLALVDEARVLLGPRRSRPPQGADADDGPRTYGHIVVDEAQDLSPMQLRMVSRRSLSGSVTAVGDIGQATGPWAPRTWADVTAHLPVNRPARHAKLTVSYRTPSEVVEVAARVLREAAPDLDPPIAARHSGFPPRFVSATAANLAQAVAGVASELVSEVSPGTTAVLAPGSLVADLVAALDATGVESADPRREGLGAPLSLLPVDLANGLEFDAVVVVEPSTIVEESAQGLRALYMALTRPTRRLAVVHSRALPKSLRT